MPGLSQFTAQTLEAFYGNPQFIAFGSGSWGPFFRVSRYDLGDGKNLAAVFRRHTKYSRTNFLRRAYAPKLHGLKRRCFAVFLESHREEIEMDPHFRLLPFLKKLLPSRLHSQIDKDFKRTSVERYVGIIRPSTWRDADSLYNLEPYYRGIKMVFLYELRLRIRRGAGKAGAFFGRVAGGNSVQLKLNNYAVDAISSVTKIARWDIYTH